jgi:hypothetical protein
MILIGIAIIGLSLILRFFNSTHNTSLISHLETYGIYEGIFIALFSFFFVPDVSIFQEKLECESCRKKEKGSIFLKIIDHRKKLLEITEPGKKYGKQIVLKYRDLSLKDGWRHRVPYWIADKDGWRYSYAPHWSGDTAHRELCPQCNLTQTKIEQEKVNEWLATPEMTEFIEIRSGTLGKVYQWLIKKEGQLVEVTTKTVDRYHDNIQESGATITQIPPPSIEPGLLGLRWPTLDIKLLPSSRFNVTVITANDKQLIYKTHWDWSIMEYNDEIVNKSLEPRSGKSDYEVIHTISLCSISNNG